MSDFYDWSGEKGSDVRLRLVYSRAEFIALVKCLYHGTANHLLLRIGLSGGGIAVPYWCHQPRFVKRKGHVDEAVRRYSLLQYHH